MNELLETASPMFCPHCGVHAEQHGPSRCLDLWVAERIGYALACLPEGAERMLLDERRGVHRICVGSGLSAAERTFIELPGTELAAADEPAPPAARQPLVTEVLAYSDPQRYDLAMTLADRATQAPYSFRRAFTDTVTQLLQQEPTEDFGQALLHLRPYHLCRAFILAGVAESDLSAGAPSSRKE